MIDKIKPTLGIFKLVTSHVPGHDSSTYLLQDQHIRIFEMSDAEDWIDTDGQHGAEYAVITVYRNI